MEILIIGGILVALMAYVSTRIKKSAASAYEAETIETAEFSLVKPEGFISPVGNASAFAFEAYSKDFGESDEAEKLRRAQANLRISANENFAVYCERAKQTFDEILSAETRGAARDGRKICLLKGENQENGVKTLEYRKIIAGESRIFDLQAIVLSDDYGVYGEKIEKMIESFQVK
ncbi:MAG TPA: hypothetical protein VF692_06045 [Pyrinomonadaceae bacterium]